MDFEVLQAIIDVLGGNMIYVAPAIFLLVVVLFADSLIELVGNALNLGNKSSRRGDY